MIKNKIVELLNVNDKKMVYAALNSGKKVMYTSNKRTAPNSYITTSNEYTIGINPNDESYFDYELLPIEKIISKEDIKMLTDYKKKNGIDKTIEAWNDTPKFNKIDLQYSLNDILKLNNTQENKQIKLLEKYFVSNDESKEYMNVVHQNSHITTACDGYKLACIYSKDNSYNYVNTENINSDYTNILRNTFETCKNQIKENLQVKINKNDLLLTLNSIKKDIQDNKENKKNKMCIVNINFRNDQMFLDSFLFSEGMHKDFSPIIKYKTDYILNIETNIQNNYGLDITKLNYSFHINYLIETLELLNLANSKRYEDNIVEMYFNKINVSPLFIIHNNIEVLVLPYKPIDLEKMKEDNEKKHKEKQDKLLENETFIQEKTEIVNTAITQFEKSIIDKQKIENVDITIYKSRYDYNTTSIVLHLMKQYNINVPLKTQGWINQALANIYYNTDNECWSYQYYSKSSKDSNTFKGYLLELINAINNKHNVIDTNVNSTIQKENDKKEYVQNIEIISFERYYNFNKDIELNTFKKNNPIYDITVQDYEYILKRVYKNLNYDSIQIQNAIKIECNFFKEEYKGNVCRSKGDNVINVCARIQNNKIIFLYEKRNKDKKYYYMEVYKNVE